MRVAIIVSHPIQYYAPWFAQVAACDGMQLRVFYLWDFGVKPQMDTKFGQQFTWNVNLLDGYEHEFVENIAPAPGTARFGGLHNPDLIPRLTDWKPDAVIAFGYGWRSLISLALRWKNSPLILRGDTHQLVRSGQSTLRSSLRHFILSRLFKRYAAFATVGQANREFYLAHGVPEHRLFTVPHCIDNARFAAASARDAQNWRQQHGLDPERPLFLFAGKFEPKKRPDLLLEAFLQAGIKDCQLVLLGDGVLRESLVSAIPSDSHQIKVLPFHNQMEMPPALRAADCLVLPSEGPHESWGLIVNEAMACGTPAIVSDHVGCAADLILEGRTGWTFPAGDRAALARVLQSAHHAVKQNNPDLRQSVRAHIKGYSYTAATAALQTMLAKVVRTSASPSP